MHDAVGMQTGNAAQQVAREDADGLFLELGHDAKHVGHGAQRHELEENAKDPRLYVASKHFDNVRMVHLYTRCIVREHIL